MDRIITVQPEDFSHLEIEPGRDFCTLLTCTPFGVNTHRLLVRGTRIPTPEQTIQTDTETAPAKSVWMEDYLRSVTIGLGAVALCAAGALVIGAVRRRIT